MNKALCNCDPDSLLCNCDPDSLFSRLGGTGWISNLQSIKDDWFKRIHESCVRCHIGMMCLNFSNALCEFNTV